MSDTTTRPTVDAILAAPEQFGIGFDVEVLEKEKMQLPATPIVVHLDLAKIQATFGDAMLLYACNQTSWRVRDQSIAREMVWKDRSVSHDAIKRRQIEARFGIKAMPTRSKETFVAVDGSKHSTSQEAQTHGLAVLAENGVTGEQARKIVGL